MISIGWNLLFTAINLIIWYILVKLFLFKPVNDIIEKRRNIINEKFNEAETAKNEAYALKAKYEDSLSSAKEERVGILEKARELADGEYKRILQEADIRAGEIMDNAKMQAREEHQKIIRETDAEIAGLVMDVTSKLVRLHSSEENDKLLYDEFITKEGKIDEP